MGDLDLRLAPKTTGTSEITHQLLGRLLLESGKIRPQDLKHSLKLQQRIDAPLGDIMVAEGLIEKQDLLCALARQAGVDAEAVAPPEPSKVLSKHLPLELCLKHGAVPWRTEASVLHVAVSSTTSFARLLRDLDPSHGEISQVIVEEAQIQAQQCKLYGRELARQAALRVLEEESCRNLGTTKHRRLTLCSTLCFVSLFGAFMALHWTITFAVLLAVATLLMTTTLKAAAFASGLRRKKPQDAATLSFRMPRVSVLVPLLREREIAGQLISRLGQLTYPKSLLNVVLVLEANDKLTRETLANTPLPDWMSVVEVPEADRLTTKPRALNYALNFCRGSIIGVWDAEDWPDADQIEKVVTRFNRAPDNVVCLQGILDYYNSRTNWLTRCFTIEYAIWWRIVMPGLARLGLVIPLGGTTLFFKRDALEELDGWDAHNVTEDADLGVRLARRGYVTELLPTVTREEATSHTRSWVRQRSRWLKGFLITYMVHMRDPGKLLRDLGFWRFMGVQTLFMASVVHFATAPFLLSFWVTLFGATHPVEHTLGAQAIWCFVGLFITAEALNLAMGIVAVSGRGRRHLLPFVPTMMVYFALGTVAAYKAIWELLHVPFYWDKTQHGVSQITDPAPVQKP